jgi:hypothetical protein
MSPTPPVARDAAYDGGSAVVGDGAVVDTGRKRHRRPITI